MNWNYFKYWLHWQLIKHETPITTGLLLLALITIAYTTHKIH